ncbi:uncharacterized protein LOC142044125 isoform X1 [Buteo buteo]|uniref:uncharacterized protein LOC142044125 isoform X1 n=1 Tax=Buteo buteo TaxID=30397 RepID=UPI003EBE8C0F
MKASAAEQKGTRQSSCTMSVSPFWHPACSVQLVNTNVNHWKLLSECRFQPDLCHDFSQGILALMNVVWDNVRSLSDIEEGWKMVNVTAIPEKVPKSEELQTVTLKSVLSKLETLASNCSGYVLRAMWSMKTVAEAITEALVTSLEALGRQHDGASRAVVEGRRRTAAEGWRQQPHPQAEFVAVILPGLLGEELVEELQRHVRLKAGPRQYLSQDKCQRKETLSTSEEGCCSSSSFFLLPTPSPPKPSRT